MLVGINHLFPAARPTRPAAAVWERAATLPAGRWEQKPVGPLTRRLNGNVAQRQPHSTKFLTDRLSPFVYFFFSLLLFLFLLLFTFFAELRMYLFFLFLQHRTLVPFTHPAQRARPFIFCSSDNPETVRLFLLLECIIIILSLYL